MAWMRMMGAESVAYHERTVLGRGDDYPGMALAYYVSRGETPLVWGGSGAATLGLEGAVTREAYGAVFGPGGACDPVTGRRLVTARRPGLELVISAHKSVAELGVIGRAEDMHRIMDAERDATLDYLDQVTRTAGGRRGRSATPTATSGLVYAHTRHATSGPGTLARTITCCWPTSSKWPTSGAGGRRPTRCCGGSICMPRPWSGGWRRPERRSSWATGSNPIRARRDGCGIGRSPVCPMR